MSSAYASIDRTSDKLRREITTPEGISLPVAIAPFGTRVGALILDLIIFTTATTIILIVLGLLGLQVFGLTGGGPMAEFLIVLAILFLFCSRYAYFLFFELGPRGATPGKRLLGIRIASRDGGRLRVESVIARNLMRDFELFLPWQFFFMALSGEGGIFTLAAAVWFLIFAFFPLFNRDRMRGGDLIAGTWVIETRNTKLASAMSLEESAEGNYQFGEAELAVYGEFELKTLERVLRDNNSEALEKVAETIGEKIGLTSPPGDERQYLQDFYAQLRARLERDMRFGKRKKDKFS
ncbi:RDD family protein [Altericroceibacterium spongiae]|uniref:RDD family protein n=1 Tax=Altericroceibacterium spongiae TaxID=2320269 RepID=A0A420EC20_9SPHN|nr:RDD family protein [Altericroceibacterium spongiae]RKF18182.1 RDD family protein [Altericroceibacterium spongiae]